MKILTLTQPYATLIALGAKTIETRSWATSYRGPIAIHAAQGLGPVGGIAGLRDLCALEPFRSVLDAHWADVRLITGWYGEPGQIVREPERCLPAGCIVAVAELVACERMTPLRELQGGWLWSDGQRWTLTDQERAFGDYAPGRSAWLLSNVRPLRTPVPCRGALGLRTLPAEVIAAVEAQL